ncbi:MAG TPA: hypothetical protein PKY10_02210 [Lentisphaeria bacterium]|nr:hypothetical protein [Lentisphaeria bacterium]
MDPRRDFTTGMTYCWNDGRKQNRTQPSWQALQAKPENYNIPPKTIIGCR